MMALELKTRGLIEKISPVLIDDKHETTNGYIYGNYFNDNCLSSVNHCIVESVIKKFTKQLDRLDQLGQGSSILEPLTVSQVLAQILVNQGTVIEGVYDEVFNSSSLILSDVLNTLMLSRERLIE